MDYLLLGPRGSDFPVAMFSAGRRIGDPESEDEIVLAGFPSHSWDAAVQMFHACRRNGVARTLGEKHGREHTGEFWTFTGASGHLNRAAIELGISLGAIHRAEAEGPVKQISTRLGEAYGRYSKVRGPQRENRDFSGEEKRHAAILCDACEAEIARLHAMALAAQTMVDNARSAYELEPVERRYRVVSDRDEEVGRLREEVRCLEESVSENLAVADRLAIESDRLKADNAELLEQNKQLAAMVEQLTAPVAPTDPSEPVKPGPKLPHKGK